MRRGIHIFAAVCSTFLLTVLASLPWDLPPTWRFLLPQLPFVSLYFWTAKDAPVLAPLLIFAAGLLMDVSSGGPLGFWSLAYLAGYGMCGIAWPIPGGSPGGVLHFTITAVLLIGFEWGVTSLHYLTPADLDPFLRALIGAWLSFAVTRIVFAWLLGQRPQVPNATLTRGR
jgi:hypothetical protein